MPELTHFDAPCPEPINSQILQMVVDNLTDISMVGIAPSKRFSSTLISGASCNS